ncbi:MAG: hypothetical protein ACYS8W_20120 [Planctomycetota bacterium]|jgi:hypothetical protein
MTFHKFNKFGRIVLAVLVIFLVASVMAGGCGSKKKKPFYVPPTPLPDPIDVGGTVYNCAAAVGDLMTYQFNTSTLEYSYLVIEGSARGEIGNGTLTPVGGFGNNVYTTTDGDTVMLIPDVFAVLQTSDNTLIAGVPRVVGGYNASEIAGTYNYLTYDREDEGVPGTMYGTIVFNANGTWELWMLKDAVTSGGSPSSTGTWTEQENGIIYLYLAIMPFGKIGSGMFFPSPTGNLLVFDIAHEGGFIIGAEQWVLPTDGSLDGIYDVLDSRNNTLYTNTLAGTTLTTPGGADLFLHNIPWDGFGANMVDTLGFITPGGIFVSVCESGIEYVTVAIKE